MKSTMIKMVKQCRLINLGQHHQFFKIHFPAYCQQLEDMIEDKMDALKNLRDKAKIFRQSLNDEEAKSRLLQGMRN